MKPTWLQQLRHDLPWFWVTVGISDLIFAAMAVAARIKAGY